jgi:hypothetical protein
VDQRLKEQWIPYSSATSTFSEIRSGQVSWTCSNHSKNFVSSLPALMWWLNRSWKTGPLVIPLALYNSITLPIHFLGSKPLGVVARFCLWIVLAMQQWHGVGVLEEVFPLLVFNSLAVLELVVPWAFGFGGGVPSEDTEAGFFPCHEQSSGWCLLPKHSLHTFPCFFRSPVWQLARGTYCYCYCYCYWGA